MDGFHRDVGKWSEMSFFPNENAYLERFWLSDRLPILDEFRRGVRKWSKMSFFPNGNAHLEHFW